MLPPGSDSSLQRDQTKRFLSDPLTLLTQYEKRYGDIFSLKLFGMNNVFMSGPRPAKFVLIENTDVFSAREGNLEVGQELFGDSILYLDGEKHRIIRETIGSLFTHDMLKRHTVAMNNIISKIFNDLPNTGVIDIHKIIKNIMLEIVINLFIDKDLDGNSIAKDVDKLIIGVFSSHPSNLPWTEFARAKRSRNNLYRILGAIIDRERQSDSDEPTLIRTLLKNNTNKNISFTNNEISDQINAFLFAGYDNSSSMAAWSIVHLATNRSVYEKLHQEVVANHDDNFVSFDELRNYKYLDAMLKETERLYPPTYFIPRLALRSVNYDQYEIPQGWLVNICPLLTHRSPLIFSEPTVFDPERFLPPREEHKKQSPSLMGFGLGAKACIGYALALAEIKLLIIHLTRHFEFNILNGEIPRNAWVPSWHPKNGVWINIKRINI